MGDRIDPILRAAGDRLRIDSAALGNSLEHRGEIGRARELMLRRTLGGFLPRRYATSTGFVLGPGNEISGQQDILIYDDDRYPNFVQEDGALLVPESLYAVISVRSELMPSDLPGHVAAATRLKELMARAVPEGPTPLYVLFAYRFDGNWNQMLNRYGEHVFNTTSGNRLDMVAALEDGGICFDASRFSGGTTATDLPAALLERVHVFGMHFHASAVDPAPAPLVDFYKLLLSGLTRLDLRTLPTYTIAPTTAQLRGRPIPEAQADAQRDIGRDDLRAEFSGKSVDLELAPGEVGQFAIIFYNAGTMPWVRGTETEARLSVVIVAGDDTLEISQGWANGWYSPDTFAAQSASEIPPASNCFFVFSVRVPQNTAPGPRRFHCRVTAGGRALAPESYANTVFVKPRSSEPDSSAEGQNATREP